jgi:hypothetical protein
MSFSDEVLAAIDRNVDAMFVAHGLDGLPRDEAFRVADSVEFVGLERWEDFHTGRYQLHRSVMPIAERIPRSTWLLWNEGDSDISLGGRSNNSDSYTHMLGMSIGVDHESGRFVHSMRRDGKTADPLPSLELRAELMSRTTWKQDLPQYSYKSGSYEFHPGVEFLGIGLNENSSSDAEPERWCRYMGWGRGQVGRAPASSPELLAAEAFYQSLGLTVGLTWIASHRN